MAHERYTDCIKECDACAAACEHCATACLSEAEVKAMADCIRLDRDCADICRLASAMMSRDSKFAKEICDEHLAGKYERYYRGPYAPKDYTREVIAIVNRLRQKWGFTGEQAPRVAPQVGQLQLAI